MDYRRVQSDLGNHSQRTAEHGEKLVTLWELRKPELRK